MDDCGSRLSIRDSLWIILHIWINTHLSYSHMAPSLLQGKDGMNHVEQWDVGTPYSTNRVAEPGINSQNFEDLKDSEPEGRRRHKWAPCHDCVCHQFPVFSSVSYEGSFNSAETQKQTRPERFSSANLSLYININCAKASGPKSTQHA